MIRAGVAPVALSTLLALLACPSLAAAQVTASPEAVEFGGVRLGTPPGQTQRTITLTNTTTFSVAIQGCQLEPPAGTDFTISSCPTSIGPMPDTSAVAVRFSPQARGSQSATVTIDYVVEAVPPQPGSVTVDLTGTGIAPVMEVSIIPAAVPPLDFGTAIVGTPSATPYTIRVANTGDDVLDALLLEGPPNPVDWTFEPAAPSFAVNPGDARDIVATFTPAADGARATTLTVRDSDEFVADVAIEMIGSGEPPLTGVGVTPTALTFGSIDVQVGEPVTRVVTIRNPGNQELVVSSIALAELDGTPYEGNAFTVRTGAPLSVGPGAEAAIEVEYRPALESAGDFAVLQLGTNVPETPRVEVTLSGRGVDRHIAVSPLQMSFQPTYRNPAAPPEAVLEVRNTGGTPLALGDVMIDAEGAAADSFAVVGQFAETIEPGDASSVTVQFRPRAAPEDPLVASLLIVNDDDDRPIVRVDMSGIGLLPPITASISLIEWGSIAVGQERPLPGSQPLVVRNESTIDTFMIQDVRAASADGEVIEGVVITGFVEPIQLGPGRELLLDVAFAPRRGGPADGALEVLVGPDPEPVVSVPIRATAVTTDARGGAGCAAAGHRSGPSGAAWLLGACALAAALGLGRGRARAWGRRGRRRSRGLAAGALLVAWAASGRPASAQVQASEDVDLASFRPVHGVDPAMVTVESADVGQSGSGALDVGFDYARNPLILRADGGEMVDRPVSSRTTVELAGAYAFGERFEVAAVVPFLSQTGQEPQFSGIAAAEGTSLGDIRVRGKAFLGARARMRFGASAELTVPSALDTQFAGVAGPSAMLRGLADYRQGRLHLAFNAGAIMRERVRLVDVQQGHAAVYGAASAVQVASRVYAVAELFGAADFSGGPSGNRPLEAVLAARVRVTREVGVLAGAGRGVLAGVGAPEARVFVAIGWSPRAREIAEPGVDPRELADDDRDGIVNRDDECNGQIEDADGFRDTDGCPDRDDDKDRVPDITDQCPRVPEDADGYADEDGCPEGDNDHDGVVDAVDRCPARSEDVDQFEDEDGCPDPDNDSDGIIDLQDRCPAEKEAINGNQDDDGCPDPGDSLVLVTGDRIETLQPIRFREDGAVLIRASQRLLGQVGATLRAERGIVRVRIRAHVHHRGDTDEALSVERAEAVRRWLVEWGVASERLEGIGFGSRFPLMEGDSSRARAANDRIELEIVERR